MVGASAAFYLALTLWITWPLAASAGRRITGDLGDPLLLTWILTWVLQHLTRALSGDLAALAQMWDANIFYPETQALAMSDHFVAQAIQVLPVWLVTHNPILCYNLSVIATFVLTGVGVQLLTRAFTGGVIAPLMAGTIASFNTYRLYLELAHLQILSIHWLPFALLALHRFIQSGSRGWLIASGLCLIALNLSATYYMLFCLPIVGLFVLADLAIERRRLDVSRLAGLGVMTICVALVTRPFVLPYIALQQRLGIVRPFEEIVAYSATFQAYARYLLPWAGIPIALAVLALVTLAFRRPPAPRAAVLLMTALTVLSVWLSFGPVVQDLGMPGPYLLLLKYVPGFDGMRAVSRYGGIALIFLPVLAGMGAAVVCRVPVIGRALVVVLTAVFLHGIWPASFMLNGVMPSQPLVTPPPAYLEPSAQLPAIYRSVQNLDGQAVLAELPFHDTWYGVRYMFFAGLHQRRLMNGYSGIEPQSFVRRRAVLTDPLAHPAAALDALRGATHVVVHQRAWTDDTGARLIAWLESAGAEAVADEDGAVLLALTPLRRNARHADAER